MENCKICLRNGVVRNGGTLGLCWTHAKRRCRNPNCGKFSDGQEHCVECAYAVDLQRWKARATLRVLDPHAQELEIGLRRERLMEAKFHYHEAVEVLFRGLVVAAEALWGELQPAEPEPQEEHPEAA